MSPFSVELLPNPAPDHDTLLKYSARLKALRLRSLQEDSGSFISKYESEVGQPEKFWLDRLRFERAFHLVPCRQAEGSGADLLEKEWVGFVVIIAPARSNERSDLAKAPEEWEMAALYIEPDVRGLGLGKRMVEETIAYIKKHSFSQEGQKAYCLTNVRHGNDNALERYQRLGFHIIDPSERVEKEGREYLATKLRIDIEGNQ